MKKILKTGRNNYIDERLEKVIFMIGKLKFTIF